MQRKHLSSGNPPVGRTAAAAGNLQVCLGPKASLLPTCDVLLSRALQAKCKKPSTFMLQHIPHKHKGMSVLRVLKAKHEKRAIMKAPHRPDLSDSTIPSQHLTHAFSSSSLPSHPGLPQPPNQEPRATPNKSQPFLNSRA